MRLYYLLAGVQKEASEVFFSVTKLYQSKDANLRRMVYLVIKDVCPGSDEVIIITSSLMKDMNSKTDLYRSNAIRVLCSITDSQLLGQIERYLKQVTAGLRLSHKPFFITPCVFFALQVLTDVGT